VRLIHNFLTVSSRPAGVLSGSVLFCERFPVPRFLARLQPSHLKSLVRTSDFDFELPPDRIAQVPAPGRDQSRLLVLERLPQRLTHHRFPEILSFLRSGDVLVLNDTKVIPARLRGVNEQTGGHFEMLLLEQAAPGQWWSMMKPGKRARPGTLIRLLNPNKEPSQILATVLEHNEEGHRLLRFSGTANILDELDTLGEIPLPPYIQRESPQDLQPDLERYQTVFATEKGSVAAPTAGLHFTPELLAKVRAAGVQICHVTLHVGLGTFAPVKAEDISEHAMHEERFHVPESTAAIVNAAKSEGRRVVAVGTTSLRVLESVGAMHDGKLIPGQGRTRIFIYPPYRFRIVDALLTNFHLPRSTLLMLVSAFAAPEATSGREFILRAYSIAVREQYRFFSYGDAMLML
jgi:S-adenosylmethionine:tRNA ribosyltransferase-isomerase